MCVRVCICVYFVYISLIVPLTLSLQEKASRFYIMELKYNLYIVKKSEIKDTILSVLAKSKKSLAHISAQ